MLPGRLRAIASMIAAVAAFSLMDGLLKGLSAHYPPMQVAVLRGLTSIPFMLWGGMVIASGLYVIWRERKRTRSELTQQSWKWTARQGRMSRRSSTVEDVARKQEEDSS